MLKKALIVSLICLGGLFSSSAAPTLGGPTLSANTSGTNGSSGGGLNTNAVIALIEEYSGGGGVVSNVTGLTLSLETRYTNDTAYYAYVSASAALTTTASASDTAAIAIKIDTDANGTYEYTAHQAAQQGRAATALSYTSELGAIISPGAVFIYDGTVAAGGGVDIPLGSGQIVYFSTNGTSGGGGGVSVSEVVSIMVTNSALYFGLTNYSQSVAFIDTNTIVLYGATDAAANGTYGWSETQQTFTNGTAVSFTYEFDPATPYITNAGGYLYAAVPSSTSGTPFPVTWEDAGGGGTPPTGYYPTNTAARVGQSMTNTFITKFPSGLAGGVGLFGALSSISVWYGPDYELSSGEPYDTRNFPTFVGSSQEVTARGPYHTVFSSRDITTLGQRVFVAASASVNAVSTNADMSIISSEFGTVRNGQGVGLIAASSNFGDLNPSGTYAIIGATGWTNNYMHFSSVLGGSAAVGGGPSRYNMDNSVGINTGSSTNWGSYYSVVVGDRMRLTNHAYSTIIGSRHFANNVTNNFLYGEGLASTSNNVVKIGFTGWHLLIQTNSLQLISNGIPYNITRAP